MATQPRVRADHPEKYSYYLAAHILPVLGAMRMADIFPEHIREWITQMQREGQSAWTSRLGILGSVVVSLVVTLIVLWIFKVI